MTESEFGLQRGNLLTHRFRGLIFRALWRAGEYR